MTDQIDAVLRRVVAEEVASAPAAPPADAVSAYLATPGPRHRTWARPVLALATVVALVVAAATVVATRDRSTVAAKLPSLLPAYLLPSWPELGVVSSSKEMWPDTMAAEPTVHVFQRVNSDPAAHELIVVVIGTGPVAPTQPVWDQLDNGDGALSFTIGDVPLTAYPRSTAITEAEVRAFAAGLRANGASASDGLDPDSGGDFATVEVFPGTAAARTPPISSATWFSDNGELTVSLTLAPSSITDTAALPVVGALRDVNGLLFLDCESQGTRVANWLDPSGTWVVVTGDGSIDLDRVVASMHLVTESEWQRVAYPNHQPPSTGS